jgi:hypothetical protein
MAGKRIILTAISFSLLIYLSMPVRERKGYCDHYGTYKYITVRSENNTVITDSICSLCKRVYSTTILYERTD